MVSDKLRELDRTHLNSGWVIVPVGGVDKIPTFLALLGAHLNVAAIIDGKSGGTQKINSLISKGVIEQNQVLPLASVLGSTEADIEDFFDESIYLKLMDEAGVASLKKRSRSPAVLTRWGRPGVGDQPDLGTPRRRQPLRGRALRARDRGPASAIGWGGSAGESVALRGTAYQPPSPSRRVLDAPGSKA